MFNKLLVTFRLGFYSLLLHKLRAALAVLGILIGITAVIWLVAMGEGVSYQAQQQIKDLGARNIIVRSNKPAQQTSQGSSSFFLEYGLTRSDFQRIVDNVPTLEQAVPMREIKREVRHDRQLMECRVVGCTPGYFQMNHLTMELGRFLSDRDMNPPDNICVIASPAALELFGYENPIGRALQINQEFYRVVGVTSARDPTAAIGGSLDSQDYNQDVYIPLETFRRRIGDMVVTSRSGSREGEIVELNQITLAVADDRYVEETAEIVRTLLAADHAEKNDVAVIVPKELLRQAEVLRWMFNILLALIAGISLLVGGIGIMNIMLATVTERTREIGIRRALGARQADIIRQFLVEAIVLTAVGGVLGILFGFLCHPAVSFSKWLAQVLKPDVYAALPSVVADLTPRINPLSIWVSFVVAVVVGVVFGLYPAYRAAMMDPIEALRHE